MSADRLDIITRLLAELTGRATTEIDPTVPISDVLGADQVLLMELLLRVDEVFPFALPSELIPDDDFLIIGGWSSEELADRIVPEL